MKVIKLRRILQDGLQEMKDVDDSTPVEFSYSPPGCYLDDNVSLYKLTFVNSGDTITIEVEADEDPDDGMCVKALREAFQDGLKIIENVDDNVKVNFDQSGGGCYCCEPKPLRQLSVLKGDEALLIDVIPRS